MINMIKADLYKIRKSNMVKVCVILCIVSAVTLAFVLRGIKTGLIDVKMSTNFSMLVDVMLVSIFGGVLTAKLICGDFESKNIHDEILSGHGRFVIILSKLIVFAILVGMLTIPYALTAMIGFSSSMEVAPLIGIPSSFFQIFSNAGEVTVNAGNIGKVILLCLLIMYLYIARLAICIPVAFKTKRTIPVIITGMLSSFVFDIIVAAGANVQGLGSALKCLPYSIIYEINLSADAGVMIKALLCGTAFIAIMVHITNQLFRKSEIK